MAHFHLAALYSLLTGVSNDAALKELDPEMIDEPGAMPTEQLDPNDPEAWSTGYFVSRFPPAFVRSLAGITDADRPGIAARWKAILVAGGESERMDCAFILNGICPLAVRAEQSGQCLILSQPAGA